MSDPLARFQKAQQLAHDASGEKEGENLHPYKAFAPFEKNDKTYRLQIRRAAGATHSPAYEYLLDVCYDGLHGTGLVLVYSFMQVKIKGKHLQPLINLIERHECLYIQDFDARTFKQPRPDEIVIESIEVIHKEDKH